MTDQKMNGFRVLIVEDEMMIAVDIEDTLKALGCDVVGPIASVKKALAVATEENFDAAILDVTLRGELIFPVAERLVQRGIPFVLASGYAQWALPEPMRVHPRLTKPFTTEELETVVWVLFNKSSHPKAAANQGQDL